MLQTDIDIFKNLQRQAEQSLNIGDEIIAYNKSRKIKGIKGKVIRKGTNTITVSLINKETLIPLTTYYKWSRFWRFEPVSMEHGGKTTGGLLVGKTDKNGGRGIKVIAPEGEIIMGGGEIVIAEEAAKKHCNELSDINVSGGGVKIPCDLMPIANQGYAKGGKIPDYIEGEISYIAGNRFEVAKIYEGIKAGEIPHKIIVVDTFNPEKQGIKIYKDLIEKEEYKSKRNGDSQKPIGLWVKFNYKGEEQVFPIDGNHRMYKQWLMGTKKVKVILIDDIDVIKKYLSDAIIDKSKMTSANKGMDEGGKICPIGTKIQTLLFSKNQFTKTQAEKWAAKNDFVYNFVDEKEHTYRIRQKDPSYFKEDSFRTIELTDGLKAVIGCPKSEHSVKAEGGEIIKTALTEEQTKRVNTEIIDTQKKLNKELSYSEDLQNKNRIAELKSHIAHLQNMITHGWKAPQFNPESPFPSPPAPKSIEDDEPMLTPTTPSHFITPANQPTHDELHTRLQHLIEDAEPRKRFLVETNRLTELCELNECLDRARAILNSGKSDEDILHYCNTLNKHISGTQYGKGGAIGSKAISYRLQILSHILQDHPITLPQNEREFVADLIVALLEEEKISKREVDKFAKNNGITNFHQAQELTELAIVKMARSIAAKQGSTEYKYNKIVELYQRQPNLAHRTSTTFLKQQYSTPAPIAYLAGIFCRVTESIKKETPKVISAKKVKEPSGGGYKMFKRISHGGSYHYEVEFADGKIYESSTEYEHPDYKPEFDRKEQIEYAIEWYKRKFSSNKQEYFEPSAGNGLLTIASKPENFIVNELDDTRRKHLWTQGYKAVWNRDASEPFTKYKEHFDAVITNPPFGSTEPVQYDGFEITGLEHLMALRVLDTLKDIGRAAIIIGGHTKYDERGRIQAGRNRNFFMYLYKHYNMQDVINISGNLYSRMGTSFDIRLILISGRKAKPEGLPPLNNANLTVLQPFSSQIVETWDILFKRIVN